MSVLANTIAGRAGTKIMEDDSFTLYELTNREHRVLHETVVRLSFESKSVNDLRLGQIAHDGEQSLLVELDPGNGHGAPARVLTTSLTDASSVELLLWTYTEHLENGRFRVEFRFFGADGALLTRRAYDGPEAPPGQWERFTVNSTFMDWPDGAAELLVLARIVPRDRDFGAARGKVYVDELTLNVVRQLTAP